MSWFSPQGSRLAAVSNDVTRLAREFRHHIEEFEKSDDPFTAMTVRMATNAFEERQEANIWRGPPQ